ncbi:ARM repeat superfamily protein, putative isoform 1 [Cucumis melo var. makuwa]|uniref:ARM repeat superfamily protein, putative isoform 1 n=1 Tax=Cucumis melo var. makuwa TaxID=1194695 RepID=A0A5D3CMN7_CUCMM|nr:ARM repeat superfamily protein, putative isoform 1 [Cucumis melo var. makuwa]
MRWTVVAIVSPFTPSNSETQRVKQCSPIAGRTKAFRSGESSCSFSLFSMEKRLRSSLESSAEEFVFSAVKLSLKSSKHTLKTLIHGLKTSSAHSLSVPLALEVSISRAIATFRNLTGSDCTNPNPQCNPSPSESPQPPSTKRLRRSSRHCRSREFEGLESDESNLNLRKEKVLSELEILSYIVFLCISHPKRVFSLTDLLPCARDLHDNLILFESDSVLSTEIANLCEEWWKEDLPGRESLISQSLPFLLSRSLTLKKKVDVHKVYMLREAFSLFDYEDESIEDLKLLLVRCVIAPLYLKTEDGRRFVAYTFGLSRQLLKEALAVIRSQIPFGRKSMLEAYGDIVFRAWRNSEENTRAEIENGFLQGLVEGAIHARTSAFGASIRRVLGGFINQRTVEGVEKLLFRLTEPVIFRSLQVANSNVRQNSLHLLLDVFPLENPDATKELKDTLLDRQFFLIEKLLMDESPDVRVVAVEVRLSTLNGVIYLFGNPQSHEILKVILPRLGHLMLDNALLVRVALADLLLLIRDVRDFQFNKVVSLDVLLTVLAHDQPIISQKITRLLMPSYFPTKVSIEEACSRCITLIRRSPMAGARFCEFAASQGASLKSIVQLVRTLIDLVSSSAKLDESYIDGLLLSAKYLCSCISKEPCYKFDLKDLFTAEKLKCLLSVAQSRCARSSLFNIVSSFSPDDFTDLLEECMQLITNCRGLSEDIEKQAEVRSGHRFFLACDALDIMFEAMSLILQKFAYRCHIRFGTEKPKLSVSSAKRKKCKFSGKVLSKLKNFGGKKCVAFEEDYFVAVGVLWQVKDLLSDEKTKNALLSCQTIETIFQSLKVICEVSIVQCVNYDYMDVSPVLAYASLALHMSFQREKLEQTLDHLLDCVKKLYVSDDSPDEAKQGCVDASEKTLKQVKNLTAVLKFIADAISMGFLSQKYELCLKFVSEYMQSIMSILCQQIYKDIQFNVEMKEIFLCLKSSLTYAAKLLNQVLRCVEGSALTQTSILSHNLIDMIALIEVHLGSGYAARLVAVAKSWFPDLILALGASCIMRPVEVERAHINLFEQTKLYFPSWLSIVAKIELSNTSEDFAEKEEEEEEDGDGSFDKHSSSTFKKFLKMIVTFLKRDHHILDAVGAIFMVGSEVGLERKDFGLVLGLLQFVCRSLYSAEDREWGDMMLASLQHCYPQIEREIEQCNGDRRHQLDKAKTLLEPIWLYHVFETGKLSMMNE